MARDLKDTPFSIERLFVWGVGIVMVTMSVLAIQGRRIAPQIQSITMFCTGAFVARLEGLLKSGGSKAEGP